MSIYVDDPDGYHIELTVPFSDPEIGRREIEKRGIDARRWMPAEELPNPIGGHATGACRAS